MKICTSTAKGGLEDKINPQFGRAPTFTFVTIENGEIKDVEIITNPFAAAAGGAGVQSAQLAAEKGASAVISGSFGPHAHTAFESAQIEMICAQNMTVRDAAISYSKGELKSTRQMPDTMRQCGTGLRHRHGRGRI